ncbi:22025_t:CDS:2, partial [Racocetra persica]
IVNTNLLSLFTEYNDNQFSNYGNNSSLFDDDNSLPLFENNNNSLLFEDDDNFNTSSSSLTENDNNPSISYQYNLNVENYFDDWLSVDRFMHNYCLKRGFGYQIFCNDKDPNDSNCKVAPITQLKMLKMKYPQHVFYKQDIYNAIYKLYKNNNKRLNFVSFLDTLFEKMLQDPCWKNLCFDTIDDNFIEDVVDEPQATLKAILRDNDISNIKETWRIHQALKNSPSLIAIESSTDTAIEQVIPKKNKFGVVFSIAKTAINIALETKSDNELVQLLKNFISTKRSIDNINSEKIDNNETWDKDGITSLQQHLIDQTNDPHVTKIRGTLSKKRMKNVIEMSKKQNIGQEITSQINNIQDCAREASLKPQH